MRIRRRYTREFKVRAVRLLDDGRSTANVAAEIGVTPDRILAWKRMLEAVERKRVNGAPTSAVPDSATAHIIPEFHDANGEIDPLAFATALSLSLEKLALIIGCDGNALGRGDLNDRERVQLSEMYRLVVALRHKLGSIDRARIWLRAPHPKLSRGAPIDYLCRRKFRVVEGVIGSIAL